jgi:hypothetical protein
VVLTAAPKVNHRLMRRRKEGPTNRSCGSMMAGNLLMGTSNNSEFLFWCDLRRALLKDKSKLSSEQAHDLERLIVQFTTKRTARAWLFREQLCDILDRTQRHASKVEPMKQVAIMIRSHFDGIVAWISSCRTNDFIEAINGLFQSANKRRADKSTFKP